MVKNKNILLPSIERWLEKQIDISRVFHGMLWTTLGNVAGSLATLASSLVLAKSFGAEIFGKYSLIQSTLAVFLILTGPSLGLFATKFIAEFRYLNPRRTASILKISTVSVTMISGIIGLTFILLTPYISEIIMRTPELKVDLYISASILFFTGLSAAQLGALSGFENFKEIAIINAVKGLLTFFLVISGGYFFGITGAISGIVAVSFIVCLIGNFYVKKLNEKYKLPKISRTDLYSEIKLIFSFSVPNLLCSLVTSIANVCVLIMLSRLPNGYVQVGVFNVANQFFLLLNFLPMIIWQVSMPMLAGISKDYRKLLVSYKKIILINIFIISLMIAFIAPFSKLLMTSVGNEFSNEVPTLIATLMLILVYASSNVAWQIMLVLNKIWMSLWFVVIYSIILIGAFLIFESDGAYGLALARIIAYSIFALLIICYIEILIRNKIRSGVI